MHEHKIVNTENTELPSKREMVVDLVTKIFERFTTVISSLVLVIDDAQWMDLQSFKVSFVFY